MKFFTKTLMLLSLSAVLFTCSGDDDGMPPGVEGSHIEIDALKDFLPADIRAEKNVRFKNPVGASMTLMADYKESVENLQTTSGESYTSDKFTVALSEGPAGDYVINMVGTGTIDSQSFKVLLVPGNGTDPVRGDIPADHINGSSVGSSNAGEYLPSLTLGTGSFNQVFKFVRDDGSSFSELYNNEEVGVVAFRDGSNTLWIFDGFE